ncbi:MAG: GntR family transcriptional regulator [Omnitrophica WOR_2 bacterium]
MAKNLYDQIYDYLLEKIELGQYQPGDRLPSEKELVAQFKVSRITTKKAMEKLMLSGVIERSRGKGSFVSRQQKSKVSVFPIPAKSILNNSSSRSGLVGVLVPDFDDTFGASFLKSIQATLHGAGHPMVLYVTGDRKEIEDQAIDRLLDTGVDGMIAIPAQGEYYSDRLLRLVIDHFPLVLVNRVMKGVSACSVVTDHYQAAKELAECLIQLGHTHIGFVSASSREASATEDRLRGLIDALGQHNLHIMAEECLSTLTSSLPGGMTGQDIDKDMQSLKEFIASNPQLTAFFVCEYNLALLLYQVLRRMNFSVPQDYSVVCFDFGRLPFIGPHFTHILQNEGLAAAKAVELLAAQIEGEPVPTRTVIPHLLVPGETTTPARQDPLIN